jgi:hypothetical protein
MKEEELRIGNYVGDEDGWIFRLSTGKEIHDGWNPVPLNKHRFKQMGFEKAVRFDDYKQQNVWRNGSFSVSIWDNGDWFYDYFGGNIQVFYVHQVQNIYYAMTGRNLELNFHEAETPSS